MDKFTFLSKDQIIGDNKLEVLKKYGLLAPITDFAVLLGGDCSSSYGQGYFKQGGDGYWWTKSYFDKEHPFIADSLGSIKNCYPITSRNVGSRLVLDYSSIPIINELLEANQDINEIPYLELPQVVLDEYASIDIEYAYQRGLLKETGQVYTTDSVYDLTPWRTTNDFKPISHIEYEFEGQKYIRYLNQNPLVEFLPDQRIIGYDTPSWVRVDPIWWLVDRNTKLLISAKVIFAGVQMDHKPKTINFEESHINSYINNVLGKELLVSSSIYENILEKELNKEKSKCLKL